MKLKIEMNHTNNFKKNVTQLLTSDLVKCDFAAVALNGVFSRTLVLNIWMELLRSVLVYNFQIYHCTNNIVVAFPFNWYFVYVWYRWLNTILSYFFFIDGLPSTFVNTRASRRAGNELTWVMTNMPSPPNWYKWVSVRSEGTFTLPSFGQMHLLS